MTHELLYASGILGGLIIVAGASASSKNSEDTAKMWLGIIISISCYVIGMGILK